jgi:hypothetical protein
LVLVACLGMDMGIIFYLPVGCSIACEAVKIKSGLHSLLFAFVPGSTKRRIPTPGA